MKAMATKNIADHRSTFRGGDRSDSAEGRFLRRLGKGEGLKSRKPGLLYLASVLFKEEEKKCRLSIAYTYSPGIA
jgi:hypothetical protein